MSPRPRRLAALASVAALVVSAGSHAVPASAQTKSWFGKPVYVSQDRFYQGAEPSIRVDASDPNQRIWITAPAGIVPNTRALPNPESGDLFWYSDDDGKTWRFVSGPAGIGSPTIVGGGDSDVATTTGSEVYGTGLTLANVTLAASCGNGERGTWTTNPISNLGTVEDRQWIDAYEDVPKPEATAPDFVLNYGGVLERRMWFHQVASPACAPPVAGPRIDTSHPDCHEGIFDDDCYQWPGNLAVDERTGDVYVTHNTFGPEPESRADVLEPVEEVCEHAVGDERCEEILEGVPERSSGSTAAAAPTQTGDDVVVARVVGGAAGPVTQLDVEVHIAAENRPDTFDSFTVAAVDRASNVYVVWTERYPGGKTRPGHTDTMLAVSRDRGETWSDPVRVNRSPETTTTTFPWIVAGDPGRIDIVYYATSAAGPSPEEVKESSLWRVWMAQSLNALSPDRTFTEMPVTPYMHRGSICTSGTGCPAGTRDLLDFFQIDVDAEGLANIAYTDNLNTPPDVNDPLTITNEADRHQEWVTFVQQVGGNRLYVK